MELKKFEAPTLAEALQVVKKELGPEAVILQTKTNKSAFGLMNRTSVEVTAAVSPEALEKKKLAERKLSSQQLEALTRKPAQKVSQAYDVLSGYRLTREANSKNSADQAFPRVDDAIKAQKQNSSARPLTQRRYADISDDESPAEQATRYSQDYARVSAPARTSIAQPVGQNPQGFRKPQMQNFSQSQNSASELQSSRPGGQVLPRLLARLIESGVEEDLVREVGDELKIIMVREQISREDLLSMNLARILMSRIRVARPLSERLRIPNTPRMISFVGPTGVGKTTTIAKIAAELVINQKRPVVLATTDTFKIAAVEQLQTYANILRIPIEVCPNAESLEALGGTLDPDAVVLIDTAGFGPKDDRKLNELQHILASVRTETHLCVSAQTRDKDLIDTVRRFRIFSPDYMVVTKLDETSSFGGIFNVTVRSQLPLSYFTMGQRVPEDMEVATKERVADLILNISGGL
jgi:flagellar biosynthesis protein FlhF